MVEQNGHHFSTQNGQMANGVCTSVADFPPIKEKIKKKSQIDKKKEGKSNLDSYVTMFAAELIGTALLMFLGCMGCLTQFDDPKPAHHFGSITFGLVVMTIIQTFGHISGAHLNPGVTLAAVLLGMLKTKMAIVYIAAQFIGAALGFGLLKGLIPVEYSKNGFCETTIYSGITTFQALGIEIVITTLLILICCSVWDPRNSDKQDSVPLRFGFIIATISMAAGPLTGASMNTARSFAPVLYSGNWQDQWIYLIGPNISVPIGCGIYRYLFAVPKDIDDNESTIETTHLDNVTTLENNKN